MGLSADEWKVQALELARVREGAGLSQSHIARAAGVAPTYICRVEGSQTYPSERVLRTYSKECALDLDSLLLKWHKMPSDLLTAMRNDPAKCLAVRKLLLSR